MGQTSHTPGPWHYTDYGNIEDMAGRVIVPVGYIYAHDVRNIAYENPKQLVAEDDGGSKNAHLIAAAPMLLEALKMLTADCMASDFNEHWESFKKAAEAIKQVEGK